MTHGNGISEPVEGALAAAAAAFETALPGLLTQFAIDGLQASIT